MKGLTIEDIRKMDAKARSEKLKDLKIELAKARTGTQSSKMRTKEIKKAIARVLTVTRAAQLQRKGGA